MSSSSQCNGASAAASSGSTGMPSSRYEGCSGAERSEAYEVGDRVELTFEVREVDESGSVWAQVVQGDGSLNAAFNLFPASARELDAGKRVPRPIKVGDTVHVRRTSYPADLKVLSIFEEWAVTTRESDNPVLRQPISFRLSDLVRVSP